ncbi:MAG TPA: gamma-glutamyltransferase, partial [Oceanipulchritudo sp.]|nr:gamma-glutamyltransferase [Oceanipulchritudo sp.]
TLQANGGLMTLEDLSMYTPIWRNPVSGIYKGNTILSMPPPSSGGLHLIQMLKLIENLPIKSWGHNSGQYAHMLTEIMKRAYADRSKYLGDPAFTEVPQEKLLSEEYEQLILGLLNSMAPTPSRFIRPGPLEEIPEPNQTTHFSIVDRHGNAVSNTTTLNFSFGCGILAEGAGFLLNNEMDDFSAKPGVPNAYGLIGGEANNIEPGKRMLSSMTPTIVLRDGKVHIVTGSPGGSRIINTVLQVIINIIDFEMNAAEAVNSPRFHHQWLPDVFQTERGFPAESLEALRYMGYDVEVGKTIGCAQTILCEEDGTLSAAGDPRRDESTARAF